jgi:hypothetical protein
MLFSPLVSNYSSAATGFMSPFLKSKATGGRINGDNLKDNTLGNSSLLIAKYLHHIGNGTEAFNTSGKVSCSTVRVVTTRIICGFMFLYGQRVY